MKRWGTILAVVLLTTGTACGSDTPAVPEPSGKGEVQTVDPAKATKLKLGDTLRVVADLPQEFGGNQVYFMSFASNNEVLGAIIPEATDSAQNGASAQSRPVMYDLETKQFTVLDDGGRSEPT